MNTETAFEDYPDSIANLTEEQKSNVIKAWINRYISLPLCNLWDLGLIVEGLKTYGRNDRETFVFTGTRCGVPPYLYDAQTDDGKLWGLGSNQFHAFREYEGAIPLGVLPCNSAPLKECAASPCLTLAIQDKALLWNHLLAEIHKALPARDFLAFAEMVKDFNPAEAGKHLVNSRPFVLGVESGLERAVEELTERAGMLFAHPSEEYRDESKAHAFRSSASEVARMLRRHREKHAIHFIDPIPF